VMDMTPSDFRRRRKLLRFLGRPQLTPADLQFLTLNLTMNPTIQQSPALHLLGLEARFIGPMSPDANNHQVIPQLFGQFFARKAELPAALDQYTYGACNCLPEKDRTREDELVYLAGVSVPENSPVPKGMKAWRVPALTYAVFQHRGAITRLGETLNYIYGTWLPRSDYDQADGPSLERYDDRFGDGGEKSEIDILVPIKLRSKTGRSK
jgi:AraC family transcriptional regulator